jgi:hypothetical protein
MATGFIQLARQRLHGHMWPILQTAVAAVVAWYVAVPRRVPLRAARADERWRVGGRRRRRARGLPPPPHGQPRVLITPFHNMALMSPATTDADVDRHTEVFREAVAALVG